MGTQFESKVERFQNAGLVLREDPAALGPGQLQENTNMISVQEGALTLRTGNQRLTNTTAFGGGSVALIHTITKLHSSATNARYVGEGANIWRTTAALPASGASLAFSNVANNAANPSLGYPQQRFAGVRYNAGSTGAPYEYFACQQKMLKDTGAFATDPSDQSNAQTGSLTVLSYQPGSDDTRLQKWGILPPWIPAISTLDAITILPSSGAYYPDMVGHFGGSTTSRINVTVTSSVFNTVGGTGPGNITITPSAMIDPTSGSVIQAGMLLVIAGVPVSVQSTTATTFTCYLSSSSLSNGAPIILGSVNETSPSAFPTIGPVTINATLTGSAKTGYTSSDIVHFSLFANQPSNITNLSFIVYVGGTNGDGTGSDYYQTNITTNLIQPSVNGVQSALQNVSAVIPNVVVGATGEYEVIDQQVQFAAPSQLNPSSPDSPTTMVWSEFDVPKNQFVAVGNAGNANQGWANITAFGLSYSVTSSTTPTIGLSGVYIYGGYGPLAVTQSATLPLLPYSYVYTFRNPVTGAESNPSQVQIATNQVSPSNQRVALILSGTGDPQIPTSGSSISVYRQGGSYADGFYRFVGYSTNPGMSGASPNIVIFYDTVADISIASNDVVQFDNDPPVTSTLPQPIVTTVSALSPSTGNANTLFTINLPSGITDLRSILTAGTSVTIGSGPDSSATNFETCVIGELPNATNQFFVWTQYPHFVGDFVTIDTVTNQACNLAIAAFDSIFVAGDPNAPHVLYKSKTGRPEAFPIVEFETGIANQINVGSPSDPIVNIAEFDNQIVCLNLSHIYVVNVFAGAMQAPIETPAQRGLFTTYAWCKANNEIWYLSYDGIYSWAGGQSVKRSEAIEPMFRGYTIGNYKPIWFGAIPGQTFTGKDVITFSYYRNEILIVYIDTSFAYHRLRYSIAMNRWWVEDLYDPQNGSPVPQSNITAQYVEPDTGNLLIAETLDVSSVTTSFLYLDDTGTSDGWVNTSSGSSSDGASIPYAVTPASYDLGAPSIQKQFSDILLEFDNDNSTGQLQIDVFYDYAASAGDTFGPLSGSSNGRRRVPFQLQSGFGKEASVATLRYSGTTKVPITLYSITFNFFSLQQLQAGRAFDWDDGGTPDDKRLTEITIWYDAKTIPQVFTLDIITGITNSQTITQDVQRFTLQTLSGTFTGPSWTQVTFPINDGIVAKKMRLRPVSVVGSFIVRDCKYSFDKYPPDVVLFTDYTDYKHPYDKRLFVLWMNVDTNGFVVPVTIQADGNTSVQTVNVSGTFNNRSIPIAVSVDVIGKLIRLKVGTIPAGGKFQLFDHRFDFEKYPADAVLSVEYNDFGYPYLKYLQQLVLDVNTNGFTVVVAVVGDGVTLQNLSVNSTQNTRDQRFTLGPQLTASKIRLVVISLPTGARFQLWSWDVIWEKADMGPVTHSTDWDYLGWPYDKQLQEITFQYDNNSQGTVTMLMDTETGIQGGTINVAAYSFFLNQTGRAIQTFPFPDNVYVKQVRVYPQSDFVQWRNWKYKISAINQPADITEFTNWNDFGYPCEKIARNLMLNIDTGGVAASINLLADGNLMQTFSVTTNTNARSAVLPCNSNLIGRLWKLDLAPGTGGKTQLYNWALDFIKEPCAVDYVDTYEQDFGVQNWKFLKQVWMRYTAPSPITMNIYVENDVLFYSTTLPAQATRELFRFYLPAGSTGALNKSRTYRIILSSSSPFKLYADSRVDYGVFGADQTGSFALSATSAETQLPVAPPQLEEVTS